MASSDMSLESHSARNKYFASSYRRKQATRGSSEVCQKLCRVLRNALGPTSLDSIKLVVFSHCKSRAYFTQLQNADIATTAELTYHQRHRYMQQAYVVDPMPFARLFEAISAAMTLRTRLNAGGSDSLAHRPHQCIYA